MELENAVIQYLKGLDSELWVKSKEIIDAVYPQFQNVYDKDTFKRLVIRVLKQTPGILENFNSPIYAYAREPRLTKRDIANLKYLFENPGPSTFREANQILSKLWKDPREMRVYDMGKAMKRLRKES